MKLENKIMTAMVVTFTFFLAELGVGMYTRSLSLLSDSFHMLHDVAAQYIAYKGCVLSQKQKKEDDQETFGWHRSNIIGGLVNGCCLASIAFILFLHAVERMIQPETIENPLLVISVAAAGLFLNVVALFVFHHHHHSHDDGHSHGLAGMLLHVFGDTLGSVGVLASGLAVYYAPRWKYVWYIDPIISALICIVLGVSTVSIIRKSMTILMQHAPSEINIGSIKNELTKVAVVDDLHIWTLANKRVMATAHVRDHESVEAIKGILHRYGVHSSTIEVKETTSPSFCQVDCDHVDLQCCRNVKK